jgi:hypothetical protein
MALTGCGATSNTVAPRSGEPAATGTPVRDGGLALSVLDVSTVREVGDPKEPGLSLTAHGVFIVVDLSITNVGSVPVTFFDNYQTLIDITGRTFEVSRAADIYANRAIRSTRLTPGTRLVVHIAFDVPAETVPAAIVLRESETSDGVTVRLS